jgi:hypothetical protein
MTSLGLKSERHLSCMHSAMFWCKLHRWATLVNNN